MVINPNTNAVITERIRTMAESTVSPGVTVDVANPRSGPMSIETADDRLVAEPHARLGSGVAGLFYALRVAEHRRQHLDLYQDIEVVIGEEVTAREGRALGIHWAFAPVVDVNNNPDNPIINVRSFGEDPEQVARLGAALVRGIQEHGAIATGKHFPGHGDTGVDSHLALPIVEASRARMDSVELKPFRAAVDAGVASLMTSFSDLNGVPATANDFLLKQVLREAIRASSAIPANVAVTAIPRADATAMIIRRRLRRTSSRWRRSS